MAERIHEKLSKKLKEMAGSVKCENITYTPPQELIEILAVNMPKDPAQALKEFQSNHRNSTHWSYKFQNNIAAYNQYKKYADAWHNEEKKILNIERKAARMALLYRVLTTIFVGFTIMGIYWVAHCLGVPMPLMRMPI